MRHTVGQSESQRRQWSNCCAFGWAVAANRHTGAGVLIQCHQPITVCHSCSYQRRHAPQQRSNPVLTVAMNHPPATAAASGEPRRPRPPPPLAPRASAAAAPASLAPANEQGETINRCANGSNSSSPSQPSACKQTPTQERRSEGGELGLVLLVPGCANQVQC